jgi:hypothetical protein
MGQREVSYHISLESVQGKEGVETIGAASQLSPLVSTYLLDNFPPWFKCSSVNNTHPTYKDVSHETNIQTRADSASGFRLPR